MYPPRAESRRRQVEDERKEASGGDPRLLCGGSGVEARPNSGPGEGLRDLGGARASFRAPEGVKGAWSVDDHAQEAGIRRGAGGWLTGCWPLLAATGHAWSLRLAAGAGARSSVRASCSTRRLLSLSSGAEGWGSRVKGALLACCSFLAFRFCFYSVLLTGGPEPHSWTGFPSCWLVCWTGARGTG